MKKKIIKAKEVKSNHPLDVQNVHYPGIYNWFLSADFTNNEWIESGYYNITFEELKQRILNIPANKGYDLILSQ